MDLLSYTAKGQLDILKEYGANRLSGLSDQKAKNQLKKYGLNEISGQAVRWWNILGRQFKSPFIYLLIVAAALALFLRETTEGVMILIFLLINAGLGFGQEYQSEKTLQLLKKYVISYVKVIRQKKEIAVHSQEIVPGDIIILETGDKIPADVRFLETTNFTVDESILTGESAPVRKISDSLPRPAKEIYQAANLGFSGTTAVNGQAKAIVLNTGAETAAGKITKLAIATRHISDFEKGIGKISTFILRLIIVTLIFVFLANLMIKGENANLIELFIFSIALAVSVIPEALPIVTTFSLSRGAMALAKQKVIIKRLSAIEDLGGIEVLCADKTGTLTENSLTVSEIYSQSSIDTLLYANIAASAMEKRKLEPFDAALWEKLTAGGRKEIKKYQRLIDNPFNPSRQRNSVLVKKNNQLELIVRGAPEVIMDLSKIKGEKKRTIKRWLNEQGLKGNRVLAVARKKIIRGAYDKNKNGLELLEFGLEFLGIISFADPIKTSTIGAIKQAAELGVRIKILTGDSKEVAGTVANQIGLIKSPKDVITAQELKKMPLSQRRKAIEEYSVFARILPEEKYKIIQMLQEKYNVGFLGEGINDLPALKIAGVSIVVQSAADIARESADIILLNKSLKSILDGIKEGRQVFANTTKYIRSTLASNFGNFYAVAIASLLIDFLPMLPIQILLLNLLSDFPMIAIAADNVDKSEITRPKKYNIKDIIIIASVLGIISTIFDFLFFGLFYRISPGVLQTNWFIGSILTELVFIFSIRTNHFFLQAKPPSKILLGLTGLAAGATIILPFTLIGQNFFKFVPPAANHLALIFFIVAIYFVCSETVKVIYYRMFNNTAEANNA